jgi:hypothetical protein
MDIFFSHTNLNVASLGNSMITVQHLKPTYHVSNITPPSELVDNSRFGNDGTFGVGASAPTWFRLPSGLWVLNYTGATEHITIPFNGSTYQKRERTVAAWCYIKATITARVISQWEAGFWDFLLGYTNAGLYRWADGGDIIATTTTTVPIDCWHFVVGTTTANGIRNNGEIFIDGVLRGTGAANNVAPVAGSTTVIGQHAALNDTEVWNGYLSQIRLWGYRLSPEQISWLFESERRLYGI